MYLYLPPSRAFRAVLTFFLPLDFTGQNRTIGLQGSAVVARVDDENEGVGVKFVKSFKELEPITVPDVPGKLRYKKLAYYLSTYVDVSLTECNATFPNGFLVERSQRFFDKDVIFQFITDAVDDQYVLEQLKQGAVPTDVLGARVTEIRKRKAPTHSDTITTG